MSIAIYSVIDASKLHDMLSALQAYTGIPIQLMGEKGQMLESFGPASDFCCLMKKHLFPKEDCFALHSNAGQYALETGESYVFACHANLTHIAFPLIRQSDLLGCVIIGPFLMDQPDTTIISELSERKQMSPGLAIDLYDSLKSLKVVSPAQVRQLRKLVEHLFSPLISSRRLLQQNLKKSLQQGQINETIQACKERDSAPNAEDVFQMEQDLLSKMRTGSIPRAKELLSQLIGVILYREGSNLKTVRARLIELDVLFSRTAIDCGARAETIWELNTQYLAMLGNDSTMEEMCHHLQQALEEFMSAMLRTNDQGNPYIRKALHYMADHYSEHLTLEEVADHVQLSPTYFSTLFRQVTGTSFRERLCSIRVEESKQLLAEGIPLADVALSVGFPDQSYYCKIFKKIVGLTPGKFRN